MADNIGKWAQREAAPDPATKPARTTPNIGTWAARQETPARERAAWPGFGLQMRDARPPVGKWEGGRGQVIRPADDPAAQLQEALTGLLAEAEDAKKAGDAEKLNAIMGRIDELVEQAPAGEDQPRDPNGQFTSWGAGGRTLPPPPPSVSELMRQALRQVQEVRAASTLILDDE